MQLIFYISATRDIVQEDKALTTKRRAMLTTDVGRAGENHRCDAVYQVMRFDLATRPSIHANNLDVSVPFALGTR